MQLWVLWDKEQPTPTEKYYGVVVTEIIQRKLKRSCHVFIMTGFQATDCLHLHFLIIGSKNVMLQLLQQGHLD